MVILNPSNCSELGILFLELSSLIPFCLLMMHIPSSLYSPISKFLIMFDCWEIIRAPTSSHTNVPSKLPIVTSNGWLLSLFCYPWFVVMKEEWFVTVLDDPDIIFWDGYVVGCKFHSSLKNVFSDSGVVVCDVESDEGCIIFVSYSSELVGNGLGVLPLVEVSFILELRVYIIQYMLTNSSNVGFFFGGVIKRYDGLVWKFGLWS